MTNSITGGWTDYTCPISKEAQKAFDKAFEFFTGVKYTPVAYASQVVNGVNYSFFCNALGIYPGAIGYPALVDIYQPFEGDPHITQIKPLKQ